MKFTDFNLDSGLLEGLADAGYVTCTPVQEQVLQNALEGADLYVQSQTGTGKTAAYLLTILQRLSSDPALSGKKALIMVPTRELAVQVEEESRILATHTKLKSASFYGGVGYGGQQDLLAKGVDVIIGTPGRVIDLQQSGTMKMGEVAFLVIDEADRMFDMGFYPDLRVLIKVLPPAEKRQTMLFSATLNATVKNLAWEYTVNAKEITIESENVTVTEIEQTLYHVSSDEKMKLLLGILQNEKPESVLIFCNTKRMSEVVAKRLKINGYEADFIIGDLPQAKRLQVIDSFKSGSLKCLVATDVAARGIDVNDLSMVINYDLPNEAENYVHRTGRTARAGKTGKAYTFCSEQDVYNLPSIQKYIEAKLESSVASEDMMVEDKSAHMYIRTDRYDNDYADDDRGSGGRGRSSGSRSSGGARSSGPSRSSGGSRSSTSGPRSSGGSRSSTSGPRSSSGPRSPDAARPDSPRSSERSRPSGENRSVQQSGSDRNSRPSGENRPRGDNRGQQVYGPDRGSSPQGSTDNERDLSKLSFEERMVYYKNKYGTEEAAREANRRNAPASRDENGPGTRRSNSGRPASPGRTASTGRPASSGRPAQTDRNERQGKPRDSRAQENGTGEGGRQGQGRNASGQNQGRQGQGRPNPGRSNPGRSNPDGQNRPPRNASPMQGKNAPAKQAPASGAKEKKSGGLAGLLGKLFGKK